jgi:hypothetical protein
MSTLTGTPIPTTGYVEKVYFNTDLSIEEVVSILEAAFVGPYTMDIMENLLSSDSCSIDVSSGLGTYYISFMGMDDETPTTLFVSQESNMGYGFVGWNPDITYPLVINSNIEGNEKNEMLSNLCSITPFKEEPVIPEEPLTLDSFLKGIADAIREKKGTAEKINAKNYKSEIRSIQTGIEPSGTLNITENGTHNVREYESVNVNAGININGMIEEYKVHAGATVNAGDFVEFVNSATNNYQQLNTTSNSCNYAPSCIMLDENRVFIAHSYGSDNHLYGTIVEMNGDAITATSAQLSSKQNSCDQAPSCILLEDNKVFIAHVGVMDPSDHTSKDYLAGTIVQINGTTMTPTTTQLLTDINIYHAPSCLLLESNKIFIAHSQGSHSVLYGTIVQINGNTMTATNAGLHDDSMYLCDGQPTCLLLENNKVFISYSSPDMNTATRIAIVEIDGTTMTATIKDEWFAYSNSNCILLEDNKVFIAYRDTWGNILCGGIAEIDGTEVTTTFTELCLDESNCMYTPSCVMLKDNKVLVVHSYGEEHYLYKTVVDINGTEMTATTTAINSTANICNNTASCLSLDANNIFIAHVDGTDNKLSATIASEGTYAKPYETAINGIAKTGGATGETVEVYVPAE